MSRAPAVRLDRLLANLGYGTRKEVRALARHGQVMLDGDWLRDAEQRIALTPDLQDRLMVGGGPVDPLPGVCLMLNKPLGVTCSHKEAGPLVYDLLPTRWRARDPAISTIGRLDKDTSGLLLLTDDGGLLHRVISPKHHVAKRYRVTLDRPLRGDEAARFAEGGLMLEGETRPLLPATMETLSPTEVFLTLTEGRYHQVRRMFAAVGNHVEALHRDRVGGLALPPGLEPGRFQVLDETRIAAIFTRPAAEPAA
ncbi:MAG: pseudouridine synthase [Pseudomonadota bacterium]